MAVSLQLILGVLQHLVGVALVVDRARSGVLHWCWMKRNQQVKPQLDPCWIGVVEAGARRKGLVCVFVLLLFSGYSWRTHGILVLCMTYGSVWGFGKEEKQYCMVCIQQMPDGTQILLCLRCYCLRDGHN